MPTENKLEEACIKLQRAIYSLSVEDRYREFCRTNGDTLALIDSETRTISREQNLRRQTRNFLNALHNLPSQVTVEKPEVLNH